MYIVDSADVRCGPIDVSILVKTTRELTYMLYENGDGLYM
jgi:hypothetical protein